MEQLPAELVTKVLEFALLPERLNLARCNTNLLRLVTRDCTTLWVHIDFYPFHNDFHHAPSKKRNGSLTDRMLSALLERVNAREVTKSLHIGGCTKIRGAGLEPLRNSRILERINLENGHHNWMGSVNEQLIREILRTLLPHNLLDVEFPSWISMRLTWPWLYQFNHKLHAMHRQRALEQGTTCDSCSLAVCYESMQVVPKVNGVPPSHCSKCLKNFCRTASCPVDMKDCTRCGKASCDECNVVRRCDECFKSFCNACSRTDQCMICKGVYCDSCSVNRGIDMSSCKTSGCENAVCGACQEQSGITFPWCDHCEWTFCSDCFPDRTCAVAKTMEDPITSALTAGKLRNAIFARKTSCSAPSALLGTAAGVVGAKSLFAKAVWRRKNLLFNSVKDMNRSTVQNVKNWDACGNVPTRWREGRG